MSRSPDDPTEVLGDDDEEPTRRLDPETGDRTPDTDILLPSMATGSPEELRTRKLAEEGVPPDDPSSGEGPGREESRGRGLWLLGISIAASLALIGIYIAAGGLDYKPADAADPCAARAWTDPGNLEETVQQFALSATDGAACELGVSREELVAALADEQSRADFAEANGLSDTEIEDALRSGLNRAIDDAENADAINPLVATGLRAAVRVLPMDQLIPLVQDASGLLDGSALDGIGGVVDGLTEELDGGSDSLGDSLPDSLPEDLTGGITDSLRDQLPPELEEAIPDSVDERIEQELDNLLNP